MSPEAAAAAISAMLLGLGALVSSLGAWKNSASVNKAVNNVDKDAPTLRYLVVKIDKELGGLREDFGNHLNKFHGEHSE